MLWEHLSETTATEPSMLCTANGGGGKSSPAQWDCLHTVRNVSENHEINILLHFHQYFVFGKNILKLKGSVPTNMLAHRFCISCKVYACAWVCISSSWFFKHLHSWAAGLSQRHGNQLWAERRCWYSPADLHTAQSFKKERENWHGTFILLWLHRKANLCFCGCIVFPSCAHFFWNGSNFTVSDSNKLLSRLNRHLLLTRQCTGEWCWKKKTWCGWHLCLSCRSNLSNVGMIPSILSEIGLRALQVGCKPWHRQQLIRSGCQLTRGSGKVQSNTKDLDLGWWHSLLLCSQHFFPYFTRSGVWRKHGGLHCQVLLVSHMAPNNDTKLSLYNAGWACSHLSCIWTMYPLNWSMLGITQ